MDWFLGPNVSVADYALSMFMSPAGAFIALGLILAVMQNKTVRKTEKLEKAKKAMIAEKKRIALEKKKQAALKKVGDAS